MVLNKRKLALLPLYPTEAEFRTPRHQDASFLEPIFEIADLCREGCDRYQAQDMAEEKSMMESADSSLKELLVIKRQTESGRGRFGR